MLKKLYTPIKYLLGFAFLIAIYYYSRLHGYHSDLEIRLWENLHLLNDENNMYYFLSNTPPLSIYNIVNFYRLTFFNLTIFAPFFLGIFTLLLTIYFRDRNPENSKRLSDALLLVIFSLNPFVLNIICNDLVSLLVAITLFFIFKGIELYMTTDSPRGIFLVAIGLPVLISSAEIGLTSFAAIFLFLPLLARHLFLKKHVTGSLMLFAFPSIATFLGITYLAWLSGIDLKNIFFMHGKINGDFNSLKLWIIFLPILIYRYKTFSRKIVDIITYNYDIFIPFTAQITLIANDRNYPTDAYISISLVLLALKMLKSKSSSRILLTGSIYLTIISWGSLSVISNSQTKEFLNATFNESSYIKSEDYKFQNWAIKMLNKKSIILSGDQYRLSIFDENNFLTTPNSKLFEKKVLNIEEYDYIFSSRTEYDKLKSKFSHFQNTRDHNLKNFSIVFSNNKWVAFKKSNHTYGIGTSEKNDFYSSFNNLFLKEFLYMLILIDVVLCFYIFFKSRKKSSEAHI